MSSAIPLTLRTNLATRMSNIYILALVHLNGLNNLKGRIRHGNSMITAIVKDGLPTSTQQDTRSFPALWLAMPQSKSLRNWLATQQVVSPSIDTATQLHVKSLTH